MEKTLKTWGYHVLIAIDQLFNALIGGAAYESEIKRRQYPAEFRYNTK